jgi:hypothetical protein
MFTRCFYSSLLLLISAAVLGAQNLAGDEAL